MAAAGCCGSPVTTSISRPPARRRRRAGQRRRGGGPRYQELLYESNRFELSPGVSVEVASPEDLEHYFHVRRTGVAPEFRVIRNMPARCAIRRAARRPRRAYARRRRRHQRRSGQAGGARQRRRLGAVRSLRSTRSLVDHLACAEVCRARLKYAQTCQDGAVRRECRGPPAGSDLVCRVPRRCRSRRPMPRSSAGSSSSTAPVSTGDQLRRRAVRPQPVRVPGGRAGAGGAAAGPAARGGRRSR